MRLNLIGGYVRHNSVACNKSTSLNIQITFKSILITCSEFTRLTPEKKSDHKINSFTILMRETAQDWCVRWENSYTFYNLRKRKRELYSFVWQFQLWYMCVRECRIYWTNEWERSKPPMDSMALVVRFNITNVCTAGAAFATKNTTMAALRIFFFILSVSMTVLAVVCGCTCFVVEALSKQKLDRTKTYISKRTFRKKKKKKSDSGGG